MMLKENALIFTGGKIFTMDEQEKVDAVAVKNGKFVEVGTLEDCKKAVPQETEIIDLKGKCMLPGFIETHIHPLMMGMGILWADIGINKVKNIPQLIEALKDFTKNSPAGTPIRGFGYDHRSLEENRQPTSKELDQVATDRLVQIWECSGHCNVVNSYFLKQMGIDKNTPNPVGGAIGRDEEGNPDGSLYDSANDYLTQTSGIKLSNHGPNIHMPYTQDECETLLKVSQDVILANGFTTVNDIQVTRQEMETYLQAIKNDQLKMRVVASYMSNYLDEMILLGLRPGLGDNKLSLGALKIYTDGAIVSGTAYSSKAYSDTVDTGRGHLYHDLEGMKEIILKAHAHGIQTATHTQGDAAHEIILEALEEAEKQYPNRNLRHRLEHSSYPTEEQVKKMGELDVWPNPQPHNFYEHGEGLVETYKEVGGEDFIPYGWFRKYDVPIYMSSDAPVSTINPAIGIYMAVTRKTRQGNIYGEQHKISVEEALKGYTIVPAKALHRENIVGSIKIGKLADITIFDKSPFEVEEEELKDLKIEQTWINGECVYRKQNNCLENRVWE